jgi:hypothetical protein
MKSLIFLGLVLVTATIATVTIAAAQAAQVAHADLSKCIPTMAKTLNDTIAVHADASSAAANMAKTWQCIHANGG